MSRRPPLCFFPPALNNLVQGVRQSCPGSYNPCKRHHCLLHWLTSPPYHYHLVSIKHLSKCLWVNECKQRSDGNRIMAYWLYFTTQIKKFLVQVEMLLRDGFYFLKNYERLVVKLQDAGHLSFDGFKEKTDFISTTALLPSSSVVWATSCWLYGITYVWLSVVRIPLNFLHHHSLQCNHDVKS